MKHMRFWFTT